MRSLRVLIVDDEELIRMGIARLVEQAGDDFQVIDTCASAREALEVLKNQETDLIITDIRMPEMDGLELLNEVKRLYPDVFSIVISGYEEFEYARTALKVGASDYILKPIDRKQFREQLLQIRNTIMNYRKKQFLQKDLENQSKKTNNLQLENFMNSVLYVCRHPHSSEWEQWLVDPFCRYRLLASSIDRNQRNDLNYSERDYELFDYALNGFLNDICQETNGSLPEGMNAYSWKGLDGWGWILLTEQRRNQASTVMDETDTESFLDKQCEQLTQRLQHIFELYLPVSVSLGISSTLEDMATISQAAAEARAAVQRRLFEGGGKCFWTHSLSVTESSLEMRSALKRVSELENRLFNVLRAFDDHAINESVEQLFSLWKQSGVSPSKLPEYVLSLVLRANLLIDEIVMEERESNPSLSIGFIESIWRKMQAKCDVLELKEELLRFLMLIAGKLKVLREGSDKEPVERAKAYIEGHLSEELTLSNVAGKVYLNPSYFSNLFKIQTGENFLNYVTRIRMEKAQRLLSQWDLKLHEIAAMVGYQNPKYFTKLFKEYSGVTPTEYRELQLK